MTMSFYTSLLELIKKKCISMFILSLFINNCERLHAICKITTTDYMLGKVSIKESIQPALDRNCVHVCCDRNIVRQINFLHYFEDSVYTNAVGYRKKIHIILLTVV